MLELICDQHYAWDNLPADSSPYRNPASAINTFSKPGSGTIEFPHANSRVLIKNGQAWQPLIALQIEVLARVDPRAARSPVLVAGQGSFRFALAEGALEAQFQNAAGNQNYVRSDASYSPDHKDHFVPANKWVKLGLHHDGFAKMRLFIDNELVGEAIVEGSIPSVQGLGVSIGNHIDQDALQFPGEMDEVKIWRLDPKATKRLFLGRPYTPQEAHCWEKHVEQTIGRLKQHPEQLKLLAQQLRSAQNSFLRSLFLLPDRDQARLRAVLAAFGALWFAGKITGPEMEKVLCDWVSLLRALNLDPENDPANNALDAVLAEMKLDSQDVLKCDPKFAAFLKLLRKALENCGKDPEVTP
jgi:hypothetical protein